MQDKHEASRLAFPALFIHAGRSWRRHAKQLWWIVLAILVPVTLMNMIGGLLDQASYGDLSWLSMLLRYGSNLLLVVAWMAVLLITAGWMEGKDVPMGEILNLAGDCYIAGAVAFLAAYVARAAGLALIGILATIAPGDSVIRSLLLLLGVPLFAVGLMMWLSFAPFIAVIEARPIATALRSSVRLSRLHLREVGAMLLLLTVLQGIVSLLVWFGGSAVDAWATQISMSSGFSFYGTSILNIAFLLPVRLIDDVTLLFVLTVFAVFFMNRRAVWEPLEEDDADADNEGKAVDTA
jgi:hypothetical protein